MPKVALSIHDQVAKLSANGLLDADSKLTSGLMTHGYFRLSGYWRYFQIDPSAGNNVFRHGTDFLTVLGIYLLDAELRNLLLEGLSELEIALRSSLVANLCAPGGHGNEYLDLEAYDSSKNSDGEEHRAVLLDSILTDLKRSKERSVMHHRREGLEQIPLWVAVEALSFGTLSRMYGLLKDAGVRDSVAKRFGYAGGLTSSFKTNIRAIAVFRNVCAHHGRIWNRVVTADKPRLFSGAFPGESNARGQYAETTWGLIRVLCHSVEQIRRNAFFADDVNALVSEIPDYKRGLTSPDRTR